jgi:hypothetical protein
MAKWVEGIVMIRCNNELEEKDGNTHSHLSPRVYHGVDLVFKKDISRH